MCISGRVLENPGAQQCFLGFPYGVRRGRVMGLWFGGRVLPDGRVSSSMRSMRASQRLAGATAIMHHWDLMGRGGDDSKINVPIISASWITGLWPWAEYGVTTLEINVIDSCTNTGTSPRVVVQALG